MSSDAERLADDESDDDPPGDSAPCRVLEVAEPEWDTGVRECEPGHDEEARPRVEAVLETFDDLCATEKAARE